jgi:hypothetical protein
VPWSNDRFALESGLKSEIAGGPFCAMYGLMQHNNWVHSMTSSARIMIVGGKNSLLILRPSVFLSELVTHAKSVRVVAFPEMSQRSVRAGTML